MEADDSGTHIMLVTDDTSYGDPVASSTGIIHLPPVEIAITKHMASYTMYCSTYVSVMT